MESERRATFSEQSFREIAIADIEDMILVVPTDKATHPYWQNPRSIAIPKRIYSEQGWLFYRNHPLGLLSGIHF